LNPPRVETSSIRIDGSLDDADWRQAAVLTGFTQYRPVDSRPAEDTTEVLVLYAADAIYFGIRGFESHGNVVRASNDPAKLLYVTMGFAPVGIRRRYYRDNDEDAIVMVKRLNERKPS